MGMTVKQSMGNKTVQNNEDVGEEFKLFLKSIERHGFYPILDQSDFAKREELKSKLANVDQDVIKDHAKTKNNDKYSLSWKNLFGQWKNSQWPKYSRWRGELCNDNSNNLDKPLDDLPVKTSPTFRK
jgi:hypothetical protein